MELLASFHYYRINNIQRYYKCAYVKEAAVAKILK